MALNSEARLSPAVTGQCNRVRSVQAGSTFAIKRLASSPLRGIIIVVPARAARASIFRRNGKVARKHEAFLGSEICIRGPQRNSRVNRHWILESRRHQKSSRAVEKGSIAAWSDRALCSLYASHAFSHYSGDKGPGKPRVSGLSNAWNRASAKEICLEILLLRQAHTGFKVSVLAIINCLVHHVPCAVFVVLAYMGFP